jgi:hypothetical protein
MMNMALESHERRLSANRSKPPGALSRTVPSNGNTVPSDAHLDHQSTANDRKRPLNNVNSESRVAPELLVASEPTYDPVRSYQPINARPHPPPPPLNSTIPPFQPASAYGGGSGGDAPYRPPSQPGTPMGSGYGQQHHNPFYGSSSAVQHPSPYTQDWLAWSQQFVPAINPSASVASPGQPPPGPPDYVKYNSASTLVQLRVGDPGAAVGTAHLPDVWPMSFLGYTPGGS